MDFNHEFKNEESSEAPDWTEGVKDDLNQSSHGKNNETKGSRKKVFTRIVSTVAAGVVGSALTLSVLPYTGYLKYLNANNSNSASITVQSAWS